MRKTIFNSPKYSQNGPTGYDDFEMDEIRKNEHERPIHPFANPSKQTTVSFQKTLKNLSNANDIKP